MRLPGFFGLSLQAIYSAYLARLTPQLVDFWQWWRTELYELLPSNLKRLVETNNHSLIISAAGGQFLVQHKSADKVQDISRIPFSADDAAELDIPDNIRQTILVLERGKVLSIEVVLPLAAEENLREVLSFEMDKNTPFTADQVYYQYFVTSRRPGDKTMSLQLFVAPRNIVDESLLRLAKIGLHPDLISPHGVDNANGHRINLVPPLKGRTHRFTRQRLNQSLGALALLLFVLMLALPIVQKNRVINSLEEDIAQAMTAATASNQLRQEVEKLALGSKYLVEKKQTETTMMHLLNEMSRVIPDDTWVNRVDIDRDEIQLQGQSGSAAGLIALIEESPTFQSAQFRSPITQVARTNQERFHLSASTPGRAEK
jgi:general secretion pathway protein L